jgi:CelD/BcsL family acetyltransferase involved in cellulose biosynthesis
MIIEINEKNIEVNVLSRDELSSELIKQWEELEDRSIEGNAYLSPHFILPAIKYLTPTAEVVIIFIRHIEGNTRLLTGVGVFEYSYGSKQFPLPHLKAYRCLHSYLSGLLVDEEFVDSTLIAFFKSFSKYKHCCGVEFIKRTGDTTLAKKMEITTSQLAIPWYQNDSRKRAILVLNKLSPDTINERLTNNIKKSIRHGRNSLSKKGELCWKAIRGREVDKGCVDRFLNLEHMGWKGSNGSSLLSAATGEAFFREMIAGFAKSGRAIFAELTVSGRTISSTSNLLSAKLGYAFKVGWDTEFTSASPGILNEVELVKNAVELFPQVQYFDSGAEEGSYIEKLWTDSYTLVSGIYITKPSAKPVAAFNDFARRIKRRFNKILK